MPALLELNTDRLSVQAHHKKLERDGNVEEYLYIRGTPRRGKQPAAVDYKALQMIADIYSALLGVKELSVEPVEYPGRQRPEKLALRLEPKYGSCSFDSKNYDSEDNTYEVLMAISAYIKDNLGVKPKSVVPVSRMEGLLEMAKDDRCDLAGWANEKEAGITERSIANHKRYAVFMESVAELVDEACYTHNIPGDMVEILKSELPRRLRRRNKDLMKSGHKTKTETLRHIVISTYGCASSRIRSRGDSPPEIDVHGLADQLAGALAGFYVEKEAASPQDALPSPRVSGVRLVQRELGKHSVMRIMQAVRLPEDIAQDMVDQFCAGPLTQPAFDELKKKVPALIAGMKPEAGPEVLQFLAREIQDGLDGVYKRAPAAER